MSEDGEKDQERAPKRSSRPVTAAARRERRASARPAGTGTDAEASKRPAPKGKAGKSSEKAAKPAGKNRPTPKQSRTDTKKRSLFSRFVRFLREVWGELRKVIWPTRKQMVTYTIVVLVFVAFMIALVYVLDFFFLKGVDVVFGN
ncbi:preprotein translocase subunit SecE [Prauserella oleivorans]|uniref:Protein translocase subunit SecE n=1 Tax=Prauserella oleivorans TaxID=1478153 RepID=A0ABW5W6R8_9PSEU